MKKVKIYLLALFAGLIMVSCTDHFVEPTEPLDPIDKKFLRKSLDYTAFLQSISSGTSNVTHDTVHVYPYAVEVERFILAEQTQARGYWEYLYNNNNPYLPDYLSPALQARRNTLTFAPSPLAHDTIFVNLVVEALEEMIGYDTLQIAKGKDTFLKNYAKNQIIGIKGILRRGISIDSLQRL
jgi:hypothetical protein